MDIITKLSHDLIFEILGKLDDVTQFDLIIKGLLLIGKTFDERLAQARNHVLLNSPKWERVFKTDYSRCDGWYGVPIRDSGIVRCQRHLPDEVKEVLQESLHPKFWEYREITLVHVENGDWRRTNWWGNRRAERPKSLCEKCVKNDI